MNRLSDSERKVHDEILAQNFIHYASTHNVSRYLVESDNVIIETARIPDPEVPSLKLYALRVRYSVGPDTRWRYHAYVSHVPAQKHLYFYTHYMYNIT